MTDTNRTHQIALAATIILTFVTGIVDAVGFLALDRVFTGNMTGNIVILGMGVAGADDLPVLGDRAGGVHGRGVSRRAGPA